MYFIIMFFGKFHARKVESKGYKADLIQNPSKIVKFQCLRFAISAKCICHSLGSKFQVEHHIPYIHRISTTVIASRAFLMNKCPSTVPIRIFLSFIQRNKYSKKTGGGGAV